MTGLRNRVRRLSAAAAGLTVVAVLGAGCGVSLQALPKPPGVGGPTYTLHATFANVVNLPENAEVRVGAFAVGYVTTLTAQDFKAMVTMKVKTAEKLPIGTTAQVQFDTPLGEDYILLVPPTLPSGGGGRPVSASDPSTGVLASGATINETDTSTAPSVEDVFGALGALLNGGGIDQLQTIIHEINNTFNGNQGQIHSLITRLNTTVSTFAASTPQLDNALQAIGSLSQELNSNSSTIVSGLNALAPAASVLAGQTTQIDQLVDELGNLSTVANRVVSQSKAGLVETLRRLQPVLTQLIDAQGQIGPALNAIDELEVTLPNSIPGNYLQVSLNALVKVQPVPSDALPLNKVTVDPPDPNESYQRNGIAVLLEGGLP